MDVPRHSRAATALLLVVSFTGILRGPCLDSLSPNDVLQRVGLRLSRSMSEGELTSLATHGDRLLRRLQPGEREALAKNALRFHIAMPATVLVAAAEREAPFWLGERGFEPTSLTLDLGEERLMLFRRRFPPGWVELGVNGLDRSPRGHYAVLVRPMAGGSQCEVKLDPNRSSGWRAVSARVGASLASDQESPIRALSPELVGSILLQPAHSRRGSALLATGRVWKTHVVSRDAPDQITAAYGDDAPHELVWTWRTEPGSRHAYLKIHGTDEGSNDAARIVRSSTRVIQCPSVLNDPVVERHRVVVSGLDPDTRYAYAIGDGSPGGWGAWKTMKTAPAPRGSTRFLYLGDAQTGLESWGRLLSKAHARHPEIDFLMIAGDLVDRGNERTNWDHFFLRAAQVLEQTPLLPCVGNHEYLDMGPRLYRAFFETPRNGPSQLDDNLVYKFESGDAFVAVLDSTLAATSPSKARIQAGWLDQALGKTRARWKFVVFHHPLYPSHPWRDVPSLREAWIPVIDKHHVDFVLQGHDHAYLRTYPMRANHRALGPDSGTYYVIAVSGDKFVADQPARDYIEVGRTELSTYQIIEVDADRNRLTYRAWSEDGRLVDQLVIDKGAPGLVAGSISRPRE